MEPHFKSTKNLRKKFFLGRKIHPVLRYMLDKWKFEAINLNSIIYASLSLNTLYEVKQMDLTYNKKNHVLVQKYKTVRLIVKFVTYETHLKRKVEYGTR